MYGDAATRVARGVALLDRKAPGWVDRIDLDTLELSSAFDCVLGQLYRGFGAGMYALNLDRESAMAHGFLTSNMDFYDELQAEWIRVIRVLRGEESSEPLKVSKAPLRTRLLQALARNPF